MVIVREKNAQNQHFWSFFTKEATEKFPDKVWSGNICLIC